MLFRSWNLKTFFFSRKGLFAMPSQNTVVARRTLIAILLAALGSACFALQAQEPARFVDQTSALGLGLASSQACWVDLDGDGWSDLCSGGIAWRNEQGKRFSQVGSGFGEVIAADLDNDGDPDLISWSNLAVYRNEGGTSFPLLASLGLPAEQTRTVSLGACAGDFNQDGFVDIYLGGFEDWENQEIGRAHV